jgi:thioesterase domain-containing protein
VLTLRETGDEPPLWLLHPGLGLGWAYRNLADCFPDRPVYTLQARGFTAGTTPAGSVSEMVTDYLQHIRERQPRGPYLLAGWSYGGTLAHALAAQLIAEGADVALVAILDGGPSGAFAEVEDLDPEMVRDYLATHQGIVRGDTDQEQLIERAVAVLANNLDVMKAYTSPKLPGDVLYFHATTNSPGSRTAAWQAHISGTVFTHDIACTHLEMYQPDPSQMIARVIRAALGSTTTARRDHVEHA